MFIVGIVDSSTTTFINVVLGFEFQSKIVPFGAKNFSENISVCILSLVLALNSIETKEQDRLYFICQLVIGLLSLSLMSFMKYKKVEK